MNNNKIIFFFFCFVVSYTALYSLSVFFPFSFLWGVNSLGYFDFSTALFLLLISVGISLTPLSEGIGRSLEKIFSVLSRKKSAFILTSVGCSLGFTFVFFHYTIATDMYGDGKTLISHLSTQVFQLFDVVDWHNTEPLSFLLYQKISHAFNLEQQQAIQMTSSVIGGMFVLCTLLFAYLIEGKIVWKVLVCVVLLSSGANQLFFGYVENYTPAYFIISIYLMLVWGYFEGKKTLVWAFIVLLIGMRFHIQCILLLPSYVFVLLYSFRKKAPLFLKLITPGMVLTMFIITCVVGTYLYFFYFHAYEISELTRKNAVKAIFLPLKNDLLIHNKYSLFSLSHISDIIQELFLTVSPLSFLIIMLGVLIPGNQILKNPRFLFYSICFFYFFLFNVTVNPILSLPRDWDMLSLATLPINFFAFSLSKQYFEKGDVNTQRKILGWGVSLSILSCSIFFINSNQDTAARRLINLGKWVYRSYYYGSAYIVNEGFTIISNPTEKIPLQEQVLLELSEYRSSPDDEMSAMYEALGKTYGENNEPLKAMQAFSLSNDHRTGNANFRLKRYEECLLELDDSLAIHPTNAYLIGLRGSTLLQLARFEEAENYLKKALSIDNTLDFAYLDLSIIYSFTGDSEKMIDILKKYYSILPPESNEAKLLENIVH